MDDSSDFFPNFAICKDYDNLPERRLMGMSKKLLRETVFVPCFACLIGKLLF